MFDKLKNFLGVNEEDEEYYDEDTVIPTRSSDIESDGDDYQPVETKKRNKIVNINTTAQLKVVLVKPERIDDASTVADHLNAKHTVVLNLESTNKELSRRLIDFVSGVCYANKGQMKRVANGTYIITPYNVDFMGDLIDELESNGIFY